MNPLIAGWVRRAFRAAGYHIEREDPQQPFLWSREPSFLELLERIEGRTLVTPDRCFALYQWVRMAAHLPGEFAELGVYRGGTALLIAEAAAGRTLHLFDTFSGMPATDGGVDVHREGDFRDTSLAAVQRLFADRGDVLFHPGRFPETAAAVAGRRFALVHVDVDIYQSVKDALEFFYPLLVPGGWLLFDDYDWQRTPGVRKALDEFLAARSIPLLVSARYQAALQKPLS